MNGDIAKIILELLTVGRVHHLWQHGSVLLFTAVSAYVPGVRQPINRKRI